MLTPTCTCTLISYKAHTGSIGHISIQKRPFIQKRPCQFKCELGGKCINKNFLQLGMGMRKGQKQGRQERTQEDYPTSAKSTQQMSGSLLAFFHLQYALFVFFFQAHP